jgi:hypothetical protein
MTKKKISRKKRVTVKRPNPRRKSAYDERIRRLQSQLGLRADGILGPATLSSLEQRVGLAATDTGTLVASRQGLDQLVTFEISSPAYYRKRLSHPAWPGVDSGVTIGIGYDLGMTPAAEARVDWSAQVDSGTLDRLMAAAGITGSRAQALAASLADITIALQSAEAVFYSRSLPLAAKTTRSLYPGIERLPADAQSMLLSVVYNRGASTTGSRRTEMANLKVLIAAPSPQDLDAIAAHVEAMARLWPDTKGLRERRIAEAAMIRGADHPYAASDLISL